MCVCGVVGGSIQRNSMGHLKLEGKGVQRRMVMVMMMMVMVMVVII